MDAKLRLQREYDAPYDCLDVAREYAVKCGNLYPESRFFAVCCGSKWRVVQDVSRAGGEFDT